MFPMNNLFCRSTLTDARNFCEMLTPQFTTNNELNKKLTRKRNMFVPREITFYTDFEIHLSNCAKFAVFR